MPTRVMGFIDGENLVRRFQAMRDEDKRTVRGTPMYIPDVFLWSNGILNEMRVDAVRMTYYTSAVGDVDQVTLHKAKIADTRYQSNGGAMPDGTLQLIPRMFKRDKNTRRSRLVDIEMTIDVMRAALETPIDGILLVTSDVDFLPLIEQVTRHTSKQVFLAGLSSGLASSSPLPSSVDRYISLDDVFFLPP